MTHVRNWLAIAPPALTAVLALFASPAPAKPTPNTVQCGQTLTHSVRMTRDLIDCPGDGLVIGAPGITVDLNGHTIDGTVTQLQDCNNVSPRGVAGISNAGGYDGLTIQNGTLQQFFSGFSAGADTTGMADSRLLDLIARDNRFFGITMGSAQRLNNGNRIEHNVAYGNGCREGIALNNAHANHVADNRVHNNGGGIAICCSDDNVVEHNSVWDNSVVGIGVVFGDDSHNVIRQNRVTGNGDIGILVALQEGEQRNVVEENAVSGSTFAGILLDDANANQVSANRLANNGDGIIVFGNRNRIASNSITDTLGCQEGCGFGISLEGGADNLIANNAVARTLRDGIRVAAFEPDIPTTDSVVRGNLVRNAGVDGLSVATEGVGSVTGTLLERNLALRSGDDGIDVESALTTLTRNLALHNTDLGIEAVPAVTDGGGNQAHRNGNPAQCSGVPCS
jgi:parallel beta-helix repeat protein